MTNPIIGIDLGTTNSVVAYTDEAGITHVIAGIDGARIVPSVAYFQAGSDPIVGERAKGYAVVEPDRVAGVFKRGMGRDTFLPSGQPFVVDGKEWRPEELSSLVLKKLKKMAEEHFGDSVTRAVITVPAYFGEPERNATRTAGELAGLEVVRLLNEPTAAAYAHGLDHGDAGRILVFDLGGGTFDVTIIDTKDDRGLEGIAIGGDHELGGSDFDQHIVSRMAQQARSELNVDITSDAYNLSEALVLAEKMKKELSTAQSSKGRVPTGSDPLNFTLTRSEFEDMLADTLRDVRDTVEFVIEKADLTSADIDTALLVGGSSRIPAFQAIIREVVGKEPTFSRNLDEDVARGAAILGAKLNTEIVLDPRSELAKMPVPIDIVSQSMGVTIINRDTGKEENSVLLPAGSKLPNSAEEIYYTVTDGQQGIELELNEGDDSDLTFVRKVGESPGRFAAPRPEGYPVRILLTLSADQIIRVQAYDGRTQDFLCEIEVTREGSLAGRELEAAKAFLAKTAVD